MTQGHKRGSRFSEEFKAKVLARFKAGESAAVIATDLKMPASSIQNWIGLHRLGKLDDNGKSITPEGAPRTKGTPKGAKRPKYKAHKRGMKRAATDAVEAPKTLAGRDNKHRVARLELELAFIKRDKAAFDKALKALGIQ